MTGPTPNADTNDPAFRSMAFDDIPTPDFADVTVVAIPPGTDPLPSDPAWWARAVFSVRSTPWWVRVLFALRQALVGLIGVKRGNRSVFDVGSVKGEEALIAADDRHLDFRAAVGIDIQHRLLRVTTTVRLHGWRGRVYFAPVSVLHGPVTRAMATAAVRRAVGPSSRGNRSVWRWLTHARRSTDGE